MTQQSDAKAICKVCGEPMPDGEEMFNYHGLSGPCPKQPLPKPKMLSAIRYFSREKDDKFWLDVEVDGKMHSSIPFGSEQERSNAYSDLLSMLDKTGAKMAMVQ